MKVIKRFFIHYSSLFIVIGLGLFGVVVFSFNKWLQAGVLVAVSAAYVVWGVTHHHMHKDLYFSVILEYLSIAAVGLIIVLSLIFRT